jgi:hypothetical protein
MDAAIVNGKVVATRLQQSWSSAGSDGGNESGDVVEDHF